MKILLHSLFVSFVFAGLVHKDADQCGPQCQRINDCACESLNSPIDTSLTPQFVSLTFDDSVLQTSYDQYYSKFLFDRKNPDGTPITASFYVPHVDSDYQVVNKLYNRGYDINLHSVVKYDVEWWANATQEEIEQQFGDNRKIISKFANISSDDIIGVRTPHTQLNGDNTLSAYQNLGLKYDSSYVLLSGNPAFPFTLEYKANSPPQVGIGPTESYPHFWVLPIINLKGDAERECNSLYACQIQGTADEISQWLFDQFIRTYTNNRAPMTIMINSVWFLVTPNSEDAFALFLDRLASYQDVFLVGHSEVLAWSRNPVPTDQYKTNFKTRSQSCSSAVFCQYFVEELNQSKYLGICGSCPFRYPWLGNPYGE